MRNLFSPLPRLLPFVAAAAATGSLAAEPLVYEPFDYPDPNLFANPQAGTGLSGDWAGWNTLVETPGLTYGSLATAGSRITISRGTATAETGSTLDGLLDDGDTLWFSVLVNPHDLSANPDLGFCLGTERLDSRNNVPMISGGSGLGFRMKNGLRATAWVGGGDPAVRTNPSSSGAQFLTAGETYLVVGELIFGATDTINVYLPDTDLNIGEVVVSQTASVDQTLFDTISIGNKDATPPDQVDEIRFGLTYADVVFAAPPSTGDPQITSITAVGANLWELTLVGQPETAYEFFSAADLDFTAATLVESLTQGDAADPGVIGGTNDSVVTTDSAGNATVQVTLSGGPRDFVRAEAVEVAEVVE